MTALLALVAAQAEDKAERIAQLLQGWQARLNLTEEQKAKTKALLEQLGQQLAPLADKVGSGMEVDKKDALQQVQAARKSFQSSFETMLTAEQKKEWGKIQEETRDHIAGTIGAKRAARMQETYTLSDDQMQACIPVLSEHTAALMDSIEEAQESQAGRRRQEKREKRQQAFELKGIADDADDELKKIFTPEQWQQYEADKAKRKEQMKQKRQQRSGG
jgi:hypothetical protein